LVTRTILGEKYRSLSSSLLNGILWRKNEEGTGRYRKRHIEELLWVVYEQNIIQGRTNKDMKGTQSILRRERL
jgi:hypothetical protein